jgi:L,D-peptidoglycan transpeptidase YkuD (ErfK/YbiS/YcfS/YnhG family)
MHITIKNKILIYKDYRIKCAVGKRGIGIKKKEGDLITPKGEYKIQFILYRKDRIKNLKTNIRKLVINKNYGWCDDPKSKKYNKLIKYPFNFSSEKMYRKDNIYDIIGVLNYNMNPIRKNKGSAIFIHVASKYLKSTKGCIAIKKNKLIKLIQNLKKNTKIRIV